MAEIWIIGEPGGPAGPFYSVVKPDGQIVAMQVLTREMAELIASIPELQAEAAKWEAAWLDMSRHANNMEEKAHTAEAEVERLQAGWQALAEAIQPHQPWVMVAPQFIREILGD